MRRVGRWCGAGAPGVSAIKCGDCPSQCYTDGLLVWARIKLLEVPCRNTRGKEDLPRAGDVVIRCGEPDVAENLKAIPDTFSVSPKERENNVEHSVPTVPFTFHISHVTRHASVSFANAFGDSLIDHKSRICSPSGQLLHVLASPFLY